PGRVADVFGIGEADAEDIRLPAGDQTFVVDAGIDIEIGKVAVAGASRDPSEEAETLILRVRLTPDHLIDDGVETEIRTAPCRIAGRCRVGEREARRIEALIRERSGMI